MDAFEERALLIQLRQGSATAFEALYDRYKHRIAGKLLKLLKSEELVQDVMQDLFMKVWVHRQHIEPESSFRSYLFRIAENMVYDIFRKAKQNKKLEAHLLQASESFYASIEEDICQAENRELLYSAINELPPQRRRVFILCKLEGRSYKEVSKLLHISTATINEHLTKANHFLRQKFTITPLRLVSILILWAVKG